MIDDAAYGCAYFVKGTRAVTGALLEQGFNVRCEESELDGTIEFQGERGEIRARGHVSRRGSVITMSGDQALNIRRDPGRFESDYRRAPPGHVIVKLGASRNGGEPLFPWWQDCRPFLRARS